MKATLVLTISLFALLAGGALGQMRRRSSTVRVKSYWCLTVLGFDYYRERLQTGEEDVLLAFFVRRLYDGSIIQQACAPGTWFSDGTGCTCSLFADVPNSGNYRRCQILDGNLQGFGPVSKQQSGYTGTLTSWVDYPYRVSIQGDNCLGTNASNPITLPQFQADSIASGNLDIQVGFKIPASFSPTTGREYEVVTTSPCGEDDDRTSSMTISYIAGDTGNINIRPRVSASLLLASRSDPTGDTSEAPLNIRCDIPAVINHPSSTIQNPRNSYAWDPFANGNVVRLQVNLNDITSSSVSLYNSEMINNGIGDTTEVPTNGFCNGQQVRTGTGMLDNRRKIAQRNCALRIGSAPRDLFLCVSSLYVRRDCTADDGI